jgi:hypothetical protein
LEPNSAKRTKQDDLIVAIGHDAVEKPPFIMGRGGRSCSTSVTSQQLLKKV